MTHNEWVKIVHDVKAPLYHKMWLKMVDFYYYVDNNKTNTKAAKAHLEAINKMRKQLGLVLISI